MGEGVRVMGWGDGVGGNVARSIWVGEGCSSPGLFSPPSVKWITKNILYLTHMHVILVHGNVPKPNSEVPHFLCRGFAR